MRDRRTASVLHEARRDVIGAGAAAPVERCETINRALTRADLDRALARRDLPTAA